MPIIDTQILEESVQHDGRQRFRARYTFSEGKTVEFDFNMHPAGTDFVALAAAKLPEIEAQEKNQELRRIYDSVVDGADYVTERDAALFNTVDELDAFMLKKTANLLRTVNNSTIKADTHKIVAHEFVFQMGFLRISNLMGISMIQAPIFRMKVNSLKNSVKGYNPSIPTYPEVEE